MTAKRILIISDAWEPQINGVVRTYQFLIRELEAMGHIVRVIGPHEFVMTLPMPGYAEIRLALRPSGLLHRLMDEFAPDIVHIGTEGPLGWSARAWCNRRSLPFSTAYHTHFPAYISKRMALFGANVANWSENLTTAYLRRFHNRAGSILVATPTLDRTLSDAGFTPPKRQMTRGVDLHLFRPEGDRASLGLRGPIALYVGRVAVEKNLGDFLQMDWPGSKVVVGDGPNRLSLQRAHPDVFFAGARTGPELASFYRAADVFVFPSRTDTFGMVLIEALSCGLPIAAYNVPGPADIVTDTRLGVLGDDLGQAALHALEICGPASARTSHVRDTYTWTRAAEQFMTAANL